MTGILQGDKVYECTALLGSTTDTLDSHGVVTRTVVPAAPITEEALKAVAAKIVAEGGYMQTPPIFSAKKVDGQRSYELARRGDVVDLKPVMVEVCSIDIKACDGNQFSFTARVGKGTYIRSLANDLAEMVGSVAYVKALRRTTIGRYSVDQAIPYHKLDENSIAEALDESLQQHPEWRHMPVKAPYRARRY